jgi:nitrous oxide reductase accessory protein NosL
MNANMFLRAVPMMVIAAIVAVGIAACGGDDRAGQPPDIEYGVSVCSRCGMIISEERYAGGIVDEKGDSLIFDDIGEMIHVIQDEGLNSRRVWVHDANSLEWIDGERAYYVASMMVMSPMGSGVTAFERREDADAFARETMGDVLEWDTILSDWSWEMRPMH